MYVALPHLNSDPKVPYVSNLPTAHSNQLSHIHFFVPTYIQEPLRLSHIHTYIHTYIHIALSPDSRETESVIRDRTVPGSHESGDEATYCHL